MKNKVVIESGTKGIGLVITGGKYRQEFEERVDMTPKQAIAFALLLIKVAQQ